MKQRILFHITMRTIFQICPYRWSAALKRLPEESIVGQMQDFVFFILICYGLLSFCSGFESLSYLQQHMLDACFFVNTSVLIMLYSFHVLKPNIGSYVAKTCTQTPVCFFSLEEIKLTFPGII